MSLVCGRSRSSQRHLQDTMYCIHTIYISGHRLSHILTQKGQKNEFETLYTLIWHHLVNITVIIGHLFVTLLVKKKEDSDLSPVSKMVQLWYNKK